MGPCSSHMNVSSPLSSGTSSQQTTWFMWVGGKAASKRFCTPPFISDHHQGRVEERGKTRFPLIKESISYLTAGSPWEKSDAPFLPEKGKNAPPDGRGLNWMRIIKRWQTESSLALWCLEVLWFRKVDGTRPWNYFIFCCCCCFSPKRKLTPFLCYCSFWRIKCY